jgi:hypothetical protein
MELGLDYSLAMGDTLPDDTDSSCLGNNNGMSGNSGPPAGFSSGGLDTSNFFGFDPSEFEKCTYWQALAWQKPPLSSCHGRLFCFFFYSFFSAC